MNCFALNVLHTAENRGLQMSAGVTMRERGKNEKNAQRPTLHANGKGRNVGTAFPAAGVLRQ